ncbi:hypothetical protein CERSUDRAFT_151409 [Gelatoporia subvermispora B]|uniref:BTB domain-containing protein n=1 Tax=Ceriporiopsis subvermispora (strain B) TaxID=914234 RepID=M2PQF2_CERS8|nr:hypothetical protein CERSUDRAFT_151409 [Gelatoporia subvermispora B]
MESAAAWRAPRSENLTRSDFWFTDGNIVLIVGHAGFKVHRGQLERHSDVFRDLFSLPQPMDQEMVEGCQCVELYDSPSDMLYLLRALYDGLYFKKSSAHDFPAIAAVLRLSTKYLIEHLRQRCLLRLETDWPTSLLGWDYRERQATDSTGRYNPRDSFPHPILVIQLAQEMRLETLLPSAFYDLSRYGPRKIVYGTVAPSPPLPTPPTSASSSGVADAAIIIRMSQEDLVTTLLGRELGQRYIAAFLDKELSERPISEGCCHKVADGGRVCRESFYFIMLNVLRSVGGIACGRDADPLFTLTQAVDMLSRTDFSDGVRQCGLKICAACKVDFADAVAKAREEVWELIPMWFGLKDAPNGI